MTETAVPAGGGEAAETLGGILSAFMRDYPDVTEGPYERRPELWAALNRARGILRDALADDAQGLEVKWSLGAGSWAKTPWFSILHEAETRTIKRGLYVAIIFREDMSGYYLMLGLGIGDYETRHGQEKGLERLHEHALNLAARFDGLEEAGFAAGCIDLDAVREQEKVFENGAVFSKFFAAEDMPGDDAFFADLRRLVAAYAGYAVNKPQGRRGHRGEYEDLLESYEPYSRDDGYAGVFMARKTFDAILDTWESRKNIVLQGPPGVGKTFLARRLAYSLTGLKSAALVETVRFHPAFGYADFMQGLAPDELGGERLKPGVFVDLCRVARNEPDLAHVLVIADMNRVDAGAVLGEAALLLDGGRRGNAWSMPLKSAVDRTVDRFFVPANIYILGLVDTSLDNAGLQDEALAARFDIFDVDPAFASGRFVEMLLEHEAAETLARAISERMAALNDAIAADPALGRGKRIGHGMLCPENENVVVDARWYEAVIRQKVLPLLRRRWRDAPEKVAEWEKTLLAPAR